VISNIIIAIALLYFSWILSQSGTAYGYIGSFVIAIFAGSIIRRALFKKRRKHRKKKYNRNWRYRR